jgi:GAF domain-containing protein
MGHGIAGLVALTGQPMAISDAGHDPRQASDIAQRIGYTPSTILCVPLYYNDQITGVLELLDKEGAPSFTTADMDLLGLFANQAAIAIELSRTHQDLSAFMSDVLKSIGSLSAGRQEQLEQGMEEFVASMEEELGYRQAMELARLVQEIAWQGEQEFKFCRTLLRSFAEYMRARPSLHGELGGRR